MRIQIGGKEVSIVKLWGHTTFQEYKNTNSWGHLYDDHTKEFKYLGFNCVLLTAVNEATNLSLPFTTSLTNNGTARLLNGIGVKLTFVMPLPRNNPIDSKNLNGYKLLKILQGKHPRELENILNKADCNREGKMEVFKNDLRERLRRIVEQARLVNIKSDAIKAFLRDNAVTGRWPQEWFPVSSSVDKISATVGKLDVAKKQQLLQVFWARAEDGSYDAGLHHDTWKAKLSISLQGSGEAAKTRRQDVRDRHILWCLWYHFFPFANYMQDDMGVLGVYNVAFYRLNLVDKVLESRDEDFKDKEGDDAMDVLEGRDEGKADDTNPTPQRKGNTSELVPEVSITSLRAIAATKRALPVGECIQIFYNWMKQTSVSDPPFSQTGKALICCLCLSILSQSSLTTVAETVITPKEMELLKGGAEFQPIFQCQIKTSASVQTSAIDVFTLSVQTMSRQKYAKQLLDSSVAEILRCLKYHICKQNKSTQTALANRGSRGGTSKEEGGAMEEEEVDTAKGILCRFQKLSIQEKFFHQVRKEIRVEEKITDKLRVCTTRLNELRAKWEVRVEDRGLDSDDEDDEGFSCSDLRIGMAKLSRLQNKLKKAAGLSTVAMAGHEGEEEKEEEDAPMDGDRGDGGGGVGGGGGGGGGGGCGTGQAQGGPVREEEMGGQTSSMHVDDSGDMNQQKKTIAQAHSLKNRVLREVKKKFFHLVARQEEANQGSIGDGDILHSNSLQINMLQALLAIADKALTEKGKPKEKEKGAECAKETEEDGAVKMGVGEGQESGEDVAKRVDENEEEEDGKEMRCEEGADEVPATYEDDKEFYSSQESFKHHLENRMTVDDVIQFRKQLKLERKRLRKAQSSRQKGIHFAHAVAHCSLLGAGGTYSSASLDLKKWKEGSAFYGTSTGSLAQTLAIAKGVKIRFWVCKRYSIEVIAPPEHYSSQECPFCLNCKKGGSERRFACMNCGLDTHRDLCKATNNQTQRVIAMGMDVRRALFPGIIVATPQEGIINTQCRGSDGAV